MEQGVSFHTHDAHNSTVNNVNGNQYNFLSVGGKPDVVNIEASDKILGLDAKIDILAVADGASWNPAVTCLPGTRVAMIEEIFQFICAPGSNDLARMFLLTGPAGSGKSAVAHTIAKRCYENGLLAASFFFSRDYQERPRRLFSTIARALAAHDKELCKEIGLAIKHDESLPTAPLSRQFQDLILAPTSIHPSGKPCVIVIDAFDESFDDQPSNRRELLKIFRDEIPKLSARFCIVLTSREGHEISSLSRKTHVFTRTIDTREQANLDDIAMFVPAMLGEVADRHNLGSGWPDQALVNDFTEQAEGLFLWVETICRYLCDATHPEKKLRNLLSTRNRKSLSAVSKMDQIYASILSTYDWDDEDFVEGYHLVMGAILTARAPLSLVALQSLYHAHTRSEISDVATRLGPLLRGTTGSHLPVQILHLSLREFLIDRARSLHSTERFYINEAVHNERLALSCLTTMNRDMDPATLGLGYLAGSLPCEMPTVPGGFISEELEYSCSFWIDHFTETGAPGPDIIDAIRIFLCHIFVPWVEILSSQGKYQSLDRLRKKLQIHAGQLSPLLHTPLHATALHHVSICLMDVAHLEEAFAANFDAVEFYRHLATDRPALFNAALADALNGLSICMSNLGRREDALNTIREAVELCRNLAPDHHAVRNPNLANFLNSLSHYLSDLGHREDALDAIREAVELQRHLADNQPTIFNSDLANSLNSLSIHLSNLGYREDALNAVREAVQLRRYLAADCPAVFTPDLAHSLNNLSDCLSNLNHREDALAAIREAVQLQRYLAADRPAVFNPDLANFLNSLSICFSNLGHREDALAAIRDAVGLRRYLATDRPAVFNPDLANSLNRLSICLTDLGHREDALDTIREAVQLYQHLAADRPAVFNPNLANSLNSLSICMSNLGYREHALDAIREAVKLRRHLAADRPSVFNAVLANSLHSLSRCLSDLGYRNDTLNAVREAVDLWRHLAAHRPAVFNVDLANSLNNLSIELSHSGHREDALDAIREAVELRRCLAADRPAVFNADLANSLNNFSIQLFNLGYREDALNIVREAVDLRRQLAAHHPAVFNPDLAESLHCLSECLSNLGHRENIPGTVQESLELRRVRRQFTAARPAVFNSNPNNPFDILILSYYLSNLGYRQDALDAIGEAVDLWRRMAADRPVVFNPALARSLHNLSYCSFDLGHREDAVKAIREAIDLFRQLTNDRPAIFGPQLANALRSLAHFSENSVGAIPEAEALSSVLR